LILCHKSILGLALNAFYYRGRLYLGQRNKFHKYQGPASRIEIVSRTRRV
jgi:hypothetical protein